MRLKAAFGLGVDKTSLPLWTYWAPYFCLGMRCSGNGGRRGFSLGFGGDGALIALGEWRSRVVAMGKLCPSPACASQLS